MDESVEVEEVNRRFYDTFERLSREKMDEVWSHGDNTVCVHPSWDLFTDWLAIRESWLRIFQNTQMIRFVITNTKVRVVNDITIVVCLENIENHVEEQNIKFGVLATNIFERSNNKWLMIHHHGSAIANYLPPNIS